MLIGDIELYFVRDVCLLLLITITTITTYTIIKHYFKI